VTNPNQRDLQSRTPVFIVSPEFVRGYELRPGIFYGKTKTVRPYTTKGINGKIHQIKCNFTEIAYAAGVKGDTARVAIERVIKKLASNVRSSGVAHMIVPTTGVFHVRDLCCAVAFDESLIKDSLITSNANLTAVDRKSHALKFLTLDRMDQFQLSQSGYDVNRNNFQGRFMSMDKDGKDYLKTLGIGGDNLFNDKYRP
jgi:hypothetical protein